MSYIAGFYVVSRFCSSGCETIVRHEVTPRTYEAKLSLFAEVCRDFASSLLSVVEQTQKKVPPVHWFIEGTGVELPREASSLFETIIDLRVEVVMVEGLSYRNGYAGRRLDLSGFWDVWDATQIEAKDRRRIAIAEVQKALASKFPESESAKRDSLRPPPVV